MQGGWFPLAVLFESMNSNKMKIKTAEQKKPQLELRGNLVDQNA